VRELSRLLYGTAAAVMAGGALLHALAWPKADGVLSRSDLPPFYAAACRGLWLSDSASSLILALLLAGLAARPGAASRWLAAVLSLVPLATALSIQATVGSFYPVYLLLAAALASLLGALLAPRAPLARSAEVTRAFRSAAH
jgi:hypothetical protein